METTKPAQTAPPTIDQVKEWTKRDLQTARYFLSVIIDRYPEVIDKIAEDLYHTAMRKENGAAIDHVAPKEYAIGE